MRKIVIALATDDNLIMQTYVSIYSVLMRRRREYFIRFIILVPEGTDLLDIDTTNWEFDNYTIEFFKVNADLFDDEIIHTRHITKPTYYRLLLPVILNDEDKCIYLDVDILCLSDIIELYDEDIENYYIGGCRGALINWNVSKEPLEKRLGIDDASDYINAGVLLMNLKLMRKDNIVDEFIIKSKENFTSQDQDVINLCCYGKIKILHMKFNVYSYVYNDYKTLIGERYPEEIINEALEHPCIIHYAREYAKPWRNTWSALGDMWWEIANAALPTTNIELLQYNLEKYMEGISFEKFLNKIEKFSEIVVWGYTKLGRVISDIINEYFHNKVVFFVDNNSSKWNEEYNGIKVVSPMKYYASYSNTGIVIAAQRYANTIKTQLSDLGFPDKNIIVYRRKNEDYFLCLDSKYRKEALMDSQGDKISMENMAFKELC